MLMRWLMVLAGLALGAQAPPEPKRFFDGPITWDVDKCTLTWTVKAESPDAKGKVRKTKKRYVLDLHAGTMTDGKTTLEFSEGEKAKMHELLNYVVVLYAVESTIWFEDPKAREALEEQNRRMREGDAATTPIDGARPL